MKSILTVVLAVLTSTSFAADSIVRRSDGATLRGTIAKSTPEAVTIKRSNGKEEVVSVSDIKTITFDKEPPQLGQARSNERGGAIEAALEKLTALKSESAAGSRAARSEVEFLIARLKTKRALVDSSTADDALKAMTTFRNGHKTNFRYLEATLLQASLHALKKQTTEGRALLEEVQASNVKGYKLQAGVDLGRLLLSAGDTSAAGSAFGKVISEAGQDPATAAARFDGMLGAALCAQAEGKSDQAIQALDQIIKDVPETETRLLAETWIRKGDSLRQKGDSKAAVLAYLHVDLLYSGEPALHAECLYQLSKLWEVVGHKDRALAAASALTTKYPNSQWAKTP